LAGLASVPRSVRKFEKKKILTLKEQELSEKRAPWGEEKGGTVGRAWRNKKSPSKRQG